MSTLTRTRISSLLRFSIPIGFAVLGLLAIMARGAEPVGNIRGIVKDEQGASLAGVKVQMCGLEKWQNGTWHRELRLGEMPSFTTDKEGRFVVPVHEADSRFDFYCDLPGYAPTFLDGITNNSPELKVTLKRGLTVTGTVHRMAGDKPEPVAGTQVELRLPADDLWYQQRTMTDHNGNYVFHVSPPPNGKKWQVIFAGEVVQLDLKDGQPVKGPDFEVTVKTAGGENQATARSAGNAQPKPVFVPDTTLEQVAWVKKCLEDLEAIKPGMTRGEVDARLGMDGGLNGVSQVRYVHPQCACLKIKVDFDYKRDANDQGRAITGKDDKALSVSSPYVEQMFMD